MSCITACGPSPERAKPSQAQHVQGGGVHRVQHACTVVLAVCILMEQRDPDPVPALNAPVVSHQLQQCFWRGAQACQKQVSGLKRLTVTGAAGHVFHDRSSWSLSRPR